MTSLDFREMRAEKPDLHEVREFYRALETDFDAATDIDARVRLMQRWNDHRKQLDTWHSLAGLHFNQDTRDEEAKRMRDAWDELSPKLKDLETGFQRKLVTSPHRPELEKRLGRYVFDRWECEITTFDPVIESDLVSEAKLSAEYTELIASARFEYRGETYNISGLGKFAQDADRNVRRDTGKLRWDWFGENGEKLDRIFDALVRLRTSMARKLGFQDFLELAYRRMTRLDYGREEVERYRDAVRAEVVPLCTEIRRRQTETLGLDRLLVFDEAVHDTNGNPKPQGDHDWMMARAHEMFDGMGSGLDSFFRLMVDTRLLDLKTRDGKASGGFCTDFPTHGVPFIFANFNGTKDDVEVFTHEMGHAFQGYLSREQFPMDRAWPTAEACEIHSMSLEFLTWPHMEKFFGDDADRFRRLHLTEGLLFLPYGVAVDHFQHLVYENPEATPAERHAMWKRMEQTYLPWRDNAGITRLEQGGLWQGQLHIYKYPLYYIDYTLAQICALQFWVWSERDRDEAMDAYVKLCKRGGEAPFQDLARGAGLKSPFDEGALTGAVQQARDTLGL